MVFNNIPQLTAEMERGISEAVLKATYAVWGESVRIIVENRFDTGEMAGATKPFILSPYQGRVSTDTKYAPFQHDGFVHWITKRFVPGEPWFVKAVAATKDDYFHDVRVALGRASSRGRGAQARGRVLDDFAGGL